MDPKLQASFIPKRPLIEGGPSLLSSRSGNVNIFFFITVALFVISLLIAGGLFALNFYENSQISKAISTLADIPKKYPYQQMLDLTRLDNRIETTKTILKRHLAVSSVFNVLSQATIKNVQFTDFKYDDTAGVKNPLAAPTFSLNGIAKSYNSVAFQSDIMRQNANFKNPIFTNLHLDDKGNVGFSIDGSFDPSVTLYSSTLAQNTTTVNGTSTTSSPAQ